MDLIRRPRARRPFTGLAVAAATALVSGVSIFVNSYGVHAVASPVLYTTAKNIVAAVVLTAFALTAPRARRSAPLGRSPDHGPVTVRGQFARRVALAYVGVVGGGLAFVLFFNGLAVSEPAPAAFWRDTLVVWVAILAAPTLRERMNWWNLASIALLVAGEIVITGGVGTLSADHGELDVLASSVLWALEVVIVKRLLRDVAPATLSVVRMSVGSLTLVGYLAASGGLGGLVELDVHQLAWVALTGLLLAGYVGTWMTALSRARAVDVTSILVAGALVTSVLQATAGTLAYSTNLLGLGLIAGGVALVGMVGRRGDSARRERAAT